MAHHDLKIWPEFFSDVRDGRKPFEIRKNDRDYANGDTMTLSEWDPDKSAYTGRKLARRVTYVLHGGRFGLEPGFVAMAIK